MKHTIAICIDDGISTQEKIVPTLGVPVSLAISTGRLGKAKFLTWDVVNKFHAAGHEIVCHGHDHRGWETMTDAQAREDIKTSLQQFAEHGIEPQGFAAPRGMYRSFESDFFKYGRVGRTNHIGYDPLHIPSVGFDSLTESTIDRSWSIYVTHMRHTTLDVELRQVTEFIQAMKQREDVEFGTLGQVAQKFIDEVKIIRGDLGCPLCGHQVMEGMNGRVKVKCAKCLTLERHRELDFLVRTMKLPIPEGPVLTISSDEMTRTFRMLGRTCYSVSPFANHLFFKDVHNMPGIPSNSIGCTVLMHVLPHVRDDKTALKEVYRVTKPGGQVLVENPFPGPVTVTYTNRPGFFRTYGKNDWERLAASMFKIRQVIQLIPTGFLYVLEK